MNRAMKNLNFRIFIWIIFGISALVWWIISLLKGISLDNLWEFVSLIPDVVFVDGALFLIFTKWGWKLKLFQGWLVPFPNLNGTWCGNIQTTWVNPDTGKVPAPIPVMLTIKQTFINISCVMRTEEMVSYSFAEDFKIDDERQIKQLVYSYLSKPKPTVAHRSSVHEGTMIFDIVGNSVNKLMGQYWTSRKSTGEIVLLFRQKELLDQLPEDFSRHPMEKENKDK